MWELSYPHTESGEGEGGGYVNPNLRFPTLSAMVRARARVDNAQLMNLHVSPWLG